MLLKAYLFKKRVSGWISRNAKRKAPAQAGNTQVELSSTEGECETLPQPFQTERIHVLGIEDDSSFPKPAVPLDTPELNRKETAHRAAFSDSATQAQNDLSGLKPPSSLSCENIFRKSAADKTAAIFLNSPEREQQGLAQLAAFLDSPKREQQQLAQLAAFLESPKRERQKLARLAAFLDSPNRDRKKLSRMAAFLESPPREAKKLTTQKVSFPVHCTRQNHQGAR